jgi:hypothetical protein
MHHLKLIALALLFLLTPFCSFAWGSEGHKITDNVAYHYLDQATKDSVAAYLDGTSFEEAGCWMDKIRSDHQYDYLKPCHYINIEKGESYKPTTEANIINELNKVIARLKERSRHTKEENAIDLKILMHLVGDLHQPLHVGYGSDKGGNKIEVSFMGHNSNLHKVCDSEIIRYSKITTDDCLSLASLYSPSGISAIEKIDVIGWMYESRSYLDRVYDFTDGAIGETYIIKTKPLIEKQLMVGGLRLSALLKDIFGSMG